MISNSLSQWLAMRYHHLLLLPPALGITPPSLNPWSPDHYQVPWPFTKEGLSETEEMTEGTCNSAVDVMAFHRGKMNEYLCKQYLAEEIEAAQRGEVFQSRAEPSQLLEDTGSEDYRDWLARSTTLEDIYRHYEQSAAADAPVPSRLPLEPFDGEVTGYAMLGTNKVSAGASDFGAGGSYGPSPGSSSYMPSLGYDLPQYGHITKSSSGSDKGMKLNDLFQLALTAIAFMAFGTFACEIIMCIMNVQTTTKKEPQIVLIGPTDKLDANKYYKMEEPIADSPPEMSRIELTPTDGLRRAKNAAEEKQFEYENSEELQKRSLLNELSEVVRYATASLDGMENAQQDGGKLLQQTLCRANLYSRSLSGSQRMWLPLWSFGMSWIGGKHLTDSTSTNFGALKLLTATIQGMAGVNCSKILL